MAGATVVSDEASVEADIASSLEAHVCIDILVSNARIRIVDPLHDHPFAEWRKMLAAGNLGRRLHQCGGCAAAVPCFAAAGSHALTGQSLIFSHGCCMEKGFLQWIHTSRVSWLMSRCCMRQSARVSASPSSFSESNA
jgi:NAD(P)-dependent dehydrogenase (short-subunit alcohol dehydrogenase family)